MSAKHAVYLAACVAIIAFAIALELPVPTLWYRPVEREWLFAARPSGIAIDFFGRCLVATASSIAATATTYAIARRLCRRDPRPVTTTAIGVLAIATMVIAIACHR